ncbi:hypothetical protein ACFX15_020839 [Malus domestica]
MPESKHYPFGHTHKRALSDSKIFNNGDDTVLPVLIVGAAPVGLVLPLLLTKLGVKCSVVEKSEAFSNHPQVHFINNRSMEVFRKLDGLAEEIQRSQPPVELWRKFLYCTSLCGSILGQSTICNPKILSKLSARSLSHTSHSTD